MGPMGGMQGKSVDMEAAMKMHVQNMMDESKLGNYKK